MTKPHHRWAALLGLYTGARVGEVAQIYLRDIVLEQNIWCVKLTVESDGQSVKTEGSKRLVPLHPDIIDLGFVQYFESLRDAGEERLFPEVNLEGKAGRGSPISKGFTYHLKRSTVAVNPRRQNGRVGFHSLRKTVIQALQGTFVSDERRRAFVGHEQSDDVHTTSYMRPWSAEELSSLWAGLKWGEWLDVPALKPLLG
jgi:integrase